MQKISSQHHFGHLMLKAFRNGSDADIFLIDGATDEKETYKSMMDRTVRLGRALRKAGLKPGDTMVLASTNNVHVYVPFYAAMYIGLPVAGMDVMYSYEEIKISLDLLRPKIAFIDSEVKDLYYEAAKELSLDMIIVTIMNGEMTIKEFTEKFDNNSALSDFEPNVYDIDKIPLLFISTSGSTGIPKLVECKQHPVFSSLFESGRFPISNEFNCRKTFLKMQPLGWVAGFYYSIVSPILNWTMLITSKQISDVINVIDVINKYRPERVQFIPMTLSFILKSTTKCDLTCFEDIAVGGTRVLEDTYILIALKTRVRSDTRIRQVYGLTETIGTICSTRGECISDCCGRPYSNMNFKLVDLETGDDITEPNKPGELLFKGPMFSGYYKNPEATAKLLTADGWLKTGDLFYKDDNGNYYFVERLKLFVKLAFNNRFIRFSTNDVEKVIRTHPGVQEVCVTTVPHDTEIDQLVAVVVRKMGHDVTAREIKLHVAESLEEAKHLRGGVVFLDSIPKTLSDKPARYKIKQIVSTSIRE